MRVFISVGMTGRDRESVMSDIERAWDDICFVYGNDVEIVHNYDCPRPEDVVAAGKLYYLGEAIKQLGTCDLCYFVQGWESHKGCRIEMEVCREYGIDIWEEGYSR